MPRAPKRFLDLRLIEFPLGLGDATQAIRIDAKQPERRSLAGAGSHERLEEIHKFTVTTPDAVGGFRRSEPECLIQGANRRERHSSLGAQLLEGHIRARCPDHDRGVKP
jgi:hypothetical protein